MKKRTAQPFYFLKQRDRVRRDAKSLSSKTEPLLGRRLDADAGSVERKRAGEIFPHPLTVGRELRSLRQNRRVNIHDRPARLRQTFPHPLKQQDAGKACVGCVRIGKELSDIAQRRRAEQSVHDGVRQHIGVAVAEQALFIRHLYAAENEPSPLRQAVDVVAVSDAQARHSSTSRSSRRRRIASATIRSSGVVILMFSSSPSVK